MAVNLQDILATFDNPEKKQFDYDDVISEIGKQLSEEQKSMPEARSEILAMQFQDNTGRDVWNTYCGPFAIGEEKETGKPVYRPDISWIKTQDIDYWAKRAYETCNPFMKMRYAGLVYDFQKKIVGHDADYRTIKLPYVQSVIDVVKGGYYFYVYVAYVYAERALSCARGFKNRELIEDAKSALWHLEELYGLDDMKSGWWSRGFELMMKYEDVFTSEEMHQKMQEHIDRLNRIEIQALKEGNHTDEYAHLADTEVRLLCKYLWKHNQQDRIGVLLIRLYKMYKAAKPARGAMWYHGMLDQLQRLFREYHYEKYANRLYVDIQDCGMEALQSMETIDIPVEVKNVDIEAYIDGFMSGTNSEVIDRYILSNIPNLQQEKREQENEEKYSPLSHIGSTVVYDDFGSPIRKIGNNEDQVFSKLMYGMYQRMRIRSIFMTWEKHKMIEKGILTVETVMQALEKSPLIIKGQLSIIKRGMESYFAEDYLVACHLLIPQFESAIRRLVAMLGGEILMHDSNPNDGNQYISLNVLLTSDVLANSGLPEDMIVYFRNLFTNQSGWNLRNLVCHGLLIEQQFNEAKADRIVHAFMILGTIQLKSTEE